MEPATLAMALKTLGKAFSVGRAAYKARQSWGLNADEIAAVESLLGGSADLVGMFKAGSVAASPRFLALHTALVTRAFGTACSRVWAGNMTMAPGFAKPSGLGRVFQSKKEEDRQTDIDTRLKRALGALAGAEKGGPAKTFDLLSALTGAPLGSPCYQALWEAFTNSLLEESGQPRLLELDDRNARLEFERAHLLAYAEALTAQAGAELAKGMVGIEASRPQLLEGANLYRADLEGANLENVICDADTKWPAGFDMARVSPPAVEAPADD